MNADLLIAVLTVTLRPDAARAKSGVYWTLIPEPDAFDKNRLRGRFRSILIPHSTHSKVVQHGLNGLFMV